MIGFVAAAIAAFFVLAYFQAPILAWTVAGGALLAYLSMLAAFGTTTNIVLGAVFLVIAALLNLRPLRRLVFSDPVLGIYRRILPDMSAKVSFQDTRTASGTSAEKVAAEN